MSSRSGTGKAHGSTGTAYPLARYIAPLWLAMSLGACGGEVAEPAPAKRDLALRQSNTGLLMTRPDADQPHRSVLARASGHTTSLGTLRRDAAAITLTCYPPHPEQAEARRSAFDPRTMRNTALR